MGANAARGLDTLNGDHGPLLRTNAAFWGSAASGVGNTPSHPLDPKAFNKVSGINDLK